MVININRSKGIIYVERSRLSYYPQEGKEIFHLPFKLDFFTDLEVTNKEEFIKKIKEFIDKSKFVIADVLIILSESVLFEKKLSIKPQDSLDRDKQIFLDNLPFDNITMRPYISEKAIRLVGVNKDLYQVIKEGFIEKGFIVRGIIPDLVLEPLAKKTDFNLILAKLILKKFSYLKQLKFLIQQPEAKDFKLFTPAEEKPHPSYLPVLMPFFIILILLFIFLFMNQARQKFNFYPQNYNLLVNPSRKPSQIMTTPLISTPSATLKR